MSVQKKISLKMVVVIHAFYLCCVSEESRMGSCALFFVLFCCCDLWLYLHISEEIFHVLKQHGCGYFPAMVSTSNK